MKTKSKITASFWRRHLNKVLVVGLTAIAGTIFVVASHADAPSQTGHISCEANTSVMTVNYSYSNVSSTSTRGLYIVRRSGQGQTNTIKENLPPPSGSGSISDTGAQSGEDYTYYLYTYGGGVSLAQIGGCALKPQGTISCLSSTQHSVTLQISYSNASSNRNVRLYAYNPPSDNQNQVATYTDGTKTFTYNDSGFSPNEPLQPGTAYKFSLSTIDLDAQSVGQKPDLTLDSKTCATTADPAAPANDGTIKATLTCSTTENGITVHASYQNASRTNQIGLYQSAYDGNFYDSYLANYADGTQAKTYSSGGYKPATKYHFYLKTGSTTLAAVDCTTIASAGSTTSTPNAKQNSGTSTNSANNSASSPTTSSTPSTGGNSTAASLQSEQTVAKAKAVHDENVRKITKTVGYSFGVLLLTGLVSGYIGFQINRRKTTL